MQPFKNVKGSVIKRGGTIAGHSYKIGKVIGGKVYMHIDYIDTLPDPEQAKIALTASKLSNAKCLSFDPKIAVYMFSEAPLFDKATEPAPRKSVKVEMSGKKVQKIYPLKDIKQVWHHKWQWVDDNYNGFDVKASYEWSKTWAAKISNPSGSLTVWKKQLSDAGLLSGLIELKFNVISDRFINAKNKIKLR